MSLEGFYCPDKELITVQECLSKCRMGERCLTLPTLKLISQERGGVIWHCSSCNRELTQLDKELVRAYNIEHGR